MATGLETWMVLFTEMIFQLLMVLERPLAKPTYFAFSVHQIFVSFPLLQTPLASQSTSLQST